MYEGGKLMERMQVCKGVITGGGPAMVSGVAAESGCGARGGEASKVGEVGSAGGAAGYGGRLASISAGVCSAFFPLQRPWRFLLRPPMEIAFFPVVASSFRNVRSSYRGSDMSRNFAMSLFSYSECD
jgi:hypothetical protein